MNGIRRTIDSLLARKLVVAFLVGFIGAFADTVSGLAQTAQPLTTSLLASAAVGAIAAGVRALLALGPVNLVPSDGTHTLTPAPRQSHPELEQSRSFAHLKLGRGPVKTDHRTLRMGSYLTSALPPTPATCDLTKGVRSWPMYANDKLSDCTFAAIGHMIEAWNHATGRARRAALAAVTRGYWETGDPPRPTGHPGDPTDNGRVELDVLNYWRNTGVGGDKITAYVAIDPRNHSHIQAAIYLFGGVYLGAALPLTAQRQTVWDVVGDGNHGGSAPGSWGGHAINGVAYDRDGVTVITWGAPMKVTWRFVDAYVEEAYAVVSPDWLAADGKTLQGFDMAALEADLAAL